MSMTLAPDVLKDDLAVSVARILATANKRARDLGVDVLQSLITISQRFENGPRWRVNYGPKDFVGKLGGDLIIEVDANDTTSKQVLRGQ